MCQHEKTRPARQVGLGKMDCELQLPSLCAGMREICLKTEFGWELRQTLGRAHFNATILTAILIRWLISAAISWAGESEEFVETVAEATECTVGAIYCAVGPSSLAAVGVCFANNAFWNLHDSVKNVGNSAA